MPIREGRVEVEDTLIDKCTALLRLHNDLITEINLQMGFNGDRVGTEQRGRVAIVEESVRRGTGAGGFAP